MKKILLSSAAIVAFAGAAAAEVTFSGDAELGYNDDFENGVYWDLGLTLGLSQELNNGWTVSGSLDIDFEDDDAGTGSSSFDLGTVSTSDWVLTLSNDMFSVSAGDVDTAFASFSAVTGLFAATDAFDDLFSENVLALEGLDTLSDSASDYLGVVPGTEDAGLLVSADYGMFSGAYSAVIADGDLGAQQLVLGAEFGAVETQLFYAEEDTDTVYASEQIALSVSTTLGGLDITGSYGTTDYFGNADTDAYGIEVSYPIGAVTLGAYYTAYSSDLDLDDAYGISVDYVDGPIILSAYYGVGTVYDDTVGGFVDDAAEYAIEGQYDFGMGLVMTAGYIDGDDDNDNDFASYIVAEYDLGGGASFLASYADAEVEGTDDIDTGVGGYELNDGTTLALSFEF